MIYILQGSCGEYSDRTDWIVRAYHDKAVADSDRTKADYETAHCLKILDEKDLRYTYSDSDDKQREAICAEILTVDVTAQFDSVGTTYWVTECELV